MIIAITILCIVCGALAYLVHLNAKKNAKLQQDLKTLKIEFKGELNAGLNNLAYGTPRGKINAHGDYELRTNEGVKLTTFQIESKEQKNTEK